MQNFRLQKALLYKTYLMPNGVKTILLQKVDCLMKPAL